MEVVLQEVLFYLIGLLVSGLFAMLLPLVKKYMRKLDWESAIPLVEDAVDEASSMVSKRLKKEAEGAYFEVDDENLGKALQYVLNSVPEAMKKGEYTEDMLREKLRARVNDFLNSD